MLTSIIESAQTIPGSKIKLLDIEDHITKFYKEIHNIKLNEEYTVMKTSCFDKQDNLIFQIEHDTKKNTIIDTQVNNPNPIASVLYKIKDSETEFNGQYFTLTRISSYLYEYPQLIQPDLVLSELTTYFNGTKNIHLEDYLISLKNIIINGRDVEHKEESYKLLLLYNTIIKKSEEFYVNLKTLKDVSIFVEKRLLPYNLVKRIIKENWSLDETIIEGIRKGYKEL